MLAASGFESITSLGENVDDAVTKEDDHSQATRGNDEAKPEGPDDVVDAEFTEK